MKTAVGTFIAVVIIGMGLGGMAVAQSTSTMNANIELARKNHEEVWSKGNMAAADEIYSNDIVRRSADQPERRGLEVYKQFVLGSRGAFPDWKETIESVIASGDLVATKVTITGTMTKPLRNLPPTGKSLEVPCVAFFRIAEGKIVEIWSYYDSVPFLKAIGVFPPPPTK